MNDLIPIIPVAILVLLLAAVLAYFLPPHRLQPPPPLPPPPPPKPARWEAVPDEIECDGPKGKETMWRVRWSVETSRGWFYVRHYGGNGTSWNKHAAESQAEQFNREGRKPESFMGFHEMPLV